LSDRQPAAVLDASALLALLQDEPGADAVASRLPACTMSAVNLSEVVAKLAEHGVPVAELRAVLEGLDLDVRPFDVEAAYQAGELRRSTRDAGLTFGDRACLALAVQLGVPQMTADRAWARVAGRTLRVELIR
jgi:ribonuclease VapC